MKYLQFFPILLLIVFFSCNSKDSVSTEKALGNSTIIGKINEYQPKFCDQFIQLIINDILTDSDKKHIAKIDTAGNFVINFQIDYPQETIIRFSGSSIYLLSFPDDTAKVIIRVGDLTGYKPTIDLIESKSKNLKYGELVNSFNHFSRRQKAKFEIESFIQGEFQDYYELMSQIKKVQLIYLDSLKASTNDLDSLLVAWAYEYIDYNFGSMAINYYSINRMLNRANVKKNVMHEGFLEKPIDMNFQIICDSILKNTGIDSYNTRSSANYAYFLNGLNAYNNYQFSQIPNNDVWQDFPKYLETHYSGDAYELLYFRFLISHLSQIELQRNKDALNDFKIELSELLIPLKNENYRLFVLEKFVRVEKIVKSDKPQALKYNLVNYPNVEHFWDKAILKKHKNKVLYIKFWAPWCGPCMGNWQSANNLVLVFGNDDFNMINICIETKEEQWNKTITQHKIVGEHYLLTRDQSSVLMAYFDIQGIPYNLIIDKHGKIRYFDAITTGSTDGSLNQTLVMQINNLLAE